MVEADKLRGDWSDPRLAKVTFGDWYARWEATRLHLRRSTRARDESVARNLILPHLASAPLGSVHPVSIRSWVAGLASEGYAPSTIQKAYQLTSAALEEAVEDGLIPRSPARAVKLPRQPDRVMRFLSVDEIDALAHAIDPRHRVLVLAAAYTGLRFGELAALTNESVHFLRRRLTVERTLTEVRGELQLTEPKTRASRRTLQLPAALVDEMAVHISQRTIPSDLIFTSAEGGPMRRTNFRRRYWIPAVLASVGEPCRFHDLRHTHAALLIAQGEHPKVIQERLGHASIRTTLDTYGHLLEGLDEAAAERLDEAFRSAHVDK